MRRRPQKKTSDLRESLWVSAGSKLDWPYFARWHYRSHHLGLIRRVLLLWHGEEPVGICVFTSPPKCLALRNHYFGRSGRWSGAALRALNSQVVMLSRVVLHPTYRGGGIAADFVRSCCQLMPYPWVETLTQMGHQNPFFERAGFVKVGACAPRERSRTAHSTIYGRRRIDGKPALVTEETFRKSQYASPVYYIFDNRAADGRNVAEG